MQVATETVPTTELGDDWLEQVLIEHYPDLLRLAYLVLHDHSEAEDVTQLALERAWRARSQVRSADRTLYWLRRIVVREALRVRSSPWRLLRLPIHLTEVDPPGRGEGVSNSAERLDMLRAFDRLPADQSAVVVLHHYLSYPVAEIAEMIGVPMETVRSRLRLAMRRLREELRDA